MLTDLDRLIQKNKELRGKYKGKNVDLDRDSKRSAKPFGYRYTGKHNYRVPTKADIKSGMKTGKVDYEGRPNRADKFPKGVRKVASHPKLADGGKIGTDMVGTKINVGGVEREVLGYKKNFGGMCQVDIDGKKKWIILKNKNSMKSGGKVKTDKKADAQRFAKPRGYRYKDKAVKDGVIKKAALSTTPSKKMRKKYPEEIDFETRTNKSDKRPSRRYKSL